ncbi:MAG: hypothetical protein NTW56_05030 [Alphaproteobacteria bacterium]|nr:hypothetical protein [Alphaproteobacteria bacterium]
MFTRLLLVAIPLLFAAPMAGAQDGPLRQTGVEAEATAADGVQARTQAHAQARRAAFARLAAAIGATPPSLSDAQIEAMVASLIIEQERITQTRYSGRLTVVFNGAAVRGVLGGAVPLGGGLAAPNPLAGTPANNFIEVSTSFASLNHWLDLRRRMLAAGPVASVDILAIAVDGARLRLGLRVPATEAAAQLASNGVVLAPPGLGDDGWRVGLGGG